jgi:hypothetical protein
MRVFVGVCGVPWGVVGPRCTVVEGALFDGSDVLGRCGVLGGRDVVVGVRGVEGGGLNFGGGFAGRGNAGMPGLGLAPPPPIPPGFTGRGVEGGVEGRGVGVGRIWAAASPTPSAHTTANDQNHNVRREWSSMEDLSHKKWNGRQALYLRLLTCALGRRGQSRSDWLRAATAYFGST